MIETDWLSVTPAILSAIAAVAAAIAAFISLSVSKQAKLISEKSILAVHHGPAAIALTHAKEELKRNTENLLKYSQELTTKWPANIGKQDESSLGGSNPRPLRHVLADAGEMLFQYGVQKQRKYKSSSQHMFSIIRDGVNSLNDTEYEKLLKQADGEYLGFENVFGTSSKKQRITESLAFRWSYYQLLRRIHENDWYNIWKEAWFDDGFLCKFKTEHNSIKTVLDSIIISLRLEKEKLSHSVYPLESNSSLFLKYEEFLDWLRILNEDCNFEIVELYREHSCKEDSVALIIYSIGVAFLSMECIDKALGGL